MLKLFDYFRSSACFRVRIALNLKNLQYEKIPIHLTQDGGEQFSELYTQKNPQQLVPTLQDKEFSLTQSLAIIQYLDDCYPEPCLIPKNAVHKAYVNSIALLLACDIHPLNNLRVLNYLKNNLNCDEEKKLAWYQYWITKGFIALEKNISSSPLSGTFCYGDKPTLADICLIPQLYNAKRFACELIAYPNLLRIEANCQKLPAFMEAAPKEMVEVNL